ncbi:hypothetical protein [Paenibacillus luteus]|uniref:hypothetical protein n=1 Tax=Paenibacillus luteus TaxID=2545753 RepID=UPI0011425246|nr:hypothetical protein [Paenibacillus luteus]
MKIENLDFQTWCRNHKETHVAKWCREVYPWVVLRNIDFESVFLNERQIISFNHIEYEITVLSIELQSNGRYKTTFRLKSNMKSGQSEWEQRKWDTVFQIIYNKEGEFITVFTKKEDPSKDLVAKFMKGSFKRITENKSRPVSLLLFNSLISYLMEMTFPNAVYLKRFAVDTEAEGYSKIFTIKSKYIYPLFSIDRSHWIFSSFNEERAHRIGLRLADQCEKLTIIFCNPTYTRHHRCKHKNVEVISLFEFYNRSSEKIREQFERQIILLQNHLSLPESKSNELILNEISQPKFTEYEIKKSELLEALAIMKIPVSNKYVAFYFFAGMNLINSWLSVNRKNPEISNKEEQLFKDMYFFKTYINKRIVEIIENNIDGVNVSFQNQFCLIELFNFQISFYNLPLIDTPENRIILDFVSSPKNKYIEWSGKRLQPVAPLIFSLARNFKREFYESLIKVNSNIS